jgi:hypothetical protein
VPGISADGYASQRTEYKDYRAGCSDYWINRHAGADLPDRTGCILFQRLIQAGHASAAASRQHRSIDLDA